MVVRKHKHRITVMSHNVEFLMASLHIQDNHGTYRDEHLMPGDGDIDWKEFLDTLHTIGYKGEMVLEAHHQSLEAEDENRDAILSEIYRRADKMREYFLKLN